MNKKPFLSVIIPTHNRLGMLKQTLACIDRQTYPRQQFEIIVVDDGSSDGTQEYLLEAARCGEMRYLRQEPARGPSAARNAGAREALGDVLVFTDDDCLPTDGWLQALADSYAERDNREAIAIGGVIENADTGHWLRRFYTVQGVQHQTNRQIEPNFLDTANASYPRVTFVSLGGFNEFFPIYSEDVDLGYRLRASGFVLRTNHAARVLHLGTTSLLAFLRRSYRIGFATALVMLEHPEYYTGVKRRGLRLRAKLALDRGVRAAAESPQPVRSVYVAIVFTFRRMIYDLAGIPLFIKDHQALQLRRYRSLGIDWRHRSLYIALEFSGYMMQMAGQAIGTFRHSYLRQASRDQ